MVNGKVLSSLITALVVGLLVIAGPVDALHLSLEGFKNTPYAFGEKVNFVGEIDINSNEIVNIQNVSLEVNDQIVCTFDVSGNLLANCTGINVSLISGLPAGYGYGYGYNGFELGWNGGNGSVNAGNYNGTEYGYGYGYSNGELSYNITIQTPQGYLNIPGNNNIKLVSHTTSQQFNSRTEHITIQPQNSGSGGSSGGSSSGSSGGSSGGSGNGNGNNEERHNNNLNSSSSNGNGRNNRLLSNPLLDSALSNQNADNQAGITGSAVSENGNGKLWLVSALLFFIAVCALASAIYYRRNYRIQNQTSYYSRSY